MPINVLVNIESHRDGRGNCRRLEGYQVRRTGFAPIATCAALEQDRRQDKVPFLESELGVRGVASPVGGHSRANLAAAVGQIRLTIAIGVD